MTRAEYNEFRYIRSYERQFDLDPGTCLTIRTDESASYKKALHDLYTGWGFDEKERIIYIHGLTFDLNGEEHPWTELYTEEERDRFSAALR